MNKIRMQHITVEQRDDTVITTTDMTNFHQRSQDAVETHAWKAAVDMFAQQTGMPPDVVFRSIAVIADQSHIKASEAAKIADERNPE